MSQREVTKSFRRLTVKKKPSINFDFCYYHASIEPIP
jgi:hypothetical protein